MQNKTRIKSLKAFSIFVLLILIFLGLYLFGHTIPVLREIPFFSTRHEHEYRPVVSEEGEIEYWTCTMHPSVRLKEPGKCPICGMDTTPVAKAEDSGGTVTAGKGESSKDAKSGAGMQAHDHSTHGMGASAKNGKDKKAKSTFTVSPERQQMIGVKTEPATVRPLDKVIRTVGMVKLDETKIYNVQTKISGWIDKVFVDFQWEHVSKGDPLFSIYSPELVSTQEEYLLALRSKEILGKSEFSEISGGANSLLNATRRRLELWDISENQIRELERTGNTKKSLIIYSPVMGHVAQKNAFENMFVEPNTVVYKIADHTTAWVQVDIYENEISLVKLGQDATMTTISLPGEEFKGNVAFIWPHLDPETRTVKVRLEFPNPDLKLLPEMYTNVNLQIPSGEGLTIPESAVLRTGKQDIVFIDKGEGKMEIRRVELGEKAGRYYQILRGLKQGEEVVMRANFLIDSESKVQAAVATWQDEPDDKEQIIKELELYPEQQPTEEPESNEKP